jgi:tetratricopeptide (TPR) repeat protein
MRFLIPFCCLLTSFHVYAQTRDQLFKGSWVKTQVVYKNGEQLPDDNQLKSSYVKYVFSNPDLLAISFDFRYNGAKMTYEVDKNILEIKNSHDYLTNSFLIEKAGNDQLVLLQKDGDGFESPYCIRYYFVPETDYQRSIPLTANDVLKIKGNDTVYKSSAKIYATYKDEDGFHDYLTANIPEFKNVENTNAHLIATYIVNEFGMADSLHMLEGINSSFDSQFTKAFNKVKKKWQPAVYGGKNVSVQMTEEFRFISGANFLPSYDYSVKGRKAMLRGEYDQALYYFDKALETYPEDTDSLYNRAICKIALGNKSGACADLNSIKRSGSTLADALIQKNCK